MRCKEQTITFYPDIHSEKTMTEVFPETRLVFETSGSTAVATAAANFAIEDGKSYIVEFDDVLHEIVAASGALANDLFRVTVADGVMTVSIAQAGSHTVRVITCTTHVCKLPEEYLPEGGGGVTSWNDLTDRPFGEEVAKHSFIEPMDLSFTNGQTSAMDATFGTAVKNKGGFVEGETYYVSIDGEEYECIGVYNSSGVTNKGVWLYPVGDHNVRVEISMMTSWHTLFAPVSDGYHNVDIFTSSKTVTHLDEKYMPTLTSPNGTKFKLTVDDSGTVSATEATE